MLRLVLLSISGLLFIGFALAAVLIAKREPPKRRFVPVVFVIYGELLLLLAAIWISLPGTRTASELDVLAVMSAAGGIFSLAALLYLHAAGFPYQAALLFQWGLSLIGSAIVAGGQAKTRYSPAFPAVLVIAVIGASVTAVASLAIVRTIHDTGRDRRVDIGQEGDGQGGDLRL